MTAHGTAVVTGAAGGIGAATTVALSEVGYDVVAVDLAFPGTSVPPGVTRHQLDLRDSAACERLISGIGSSLTVLVNSAAVRPAAPLIDQDVDGWRWAFEVNALSAFVMLRAAALHMGPGGVIVNIASAAAYGKRNLIAYGASKAALISMTKTAAIELDQQQVRVNAVVPGTTATAMLSSAGLSLREPKNRNVGGEVLAPAAVAASVLRAINDPMLSGAVLPVGLLPAEW